MNLVKDAVTKRPFAQLPFMSESTFASFLRDRGLNVWPRGIPSFVDSHLIDRLAAPSGDFHPFQIWPISQVFRELELQIDAGISHWGLDPVGLKDYIDRNWPSRAKVLTKFPKSKDCLEFNSQVLPLLLWLEPHFVPVIHGSRPRLLRLMNTPRLMWHKWQSSSRLEDLLDKHSISIEHLSEWREKILSQAYLSDPSPDLYLLLRSMPIEQRQRLRGSLRLAYDLYEIAEIVRLFLEQVTNQPVTKEWGPTDSPGMPWVERNYGSQPQFGEPPFLRQVIRSYGLDPAYRARWLVEGATEEGFIVRYAERLGADIREFVSIRDFGGDGAFQKKQAAIDSDLEAARREQCFVTLTFDDEPATRRRLDGLLNKGLVNLPFTLNEPDFELENFTIDQLVTVATNWASDLKKPINMCPAELTQRVEGRICQKGIDFQKALNDVLCTAGEEYKLSKGIEWGERLADHISLLREQQAEAGEYSVGTLSKIEQQTLRILGDSEPAINYPLSIKKLNPNFLEIVNSSPNKALETNRRAGCESTLVHGCGG